MCLNLACNAEVVRGGDPTPLGRTVYFPKSSSAFKTQNGGYSVRLRNKYACTAG